MKTVQPVRLTVNGVEYDLLVEPRALLTDLLRDYLGLTGTKRGCETAKCGACTVVLNGRAVKSCNVLALRAAGGTVLTVEGLAVNGLHPLQQAFMENHSLQCGFCTSGILLAAKAFLNVNPDPTEEQVRVAISGNICRCTGYQKVVEGILDGAKRLRAGR